MSGAVGVSHAGERRLHDKLGTGKRQHDLGLRMIRNDNPDPHRCFVAKHRTVHIGAVDDTAIQFSKGNENSFFNTYELPILGDGPRIRVQTVTRAQGVLPYRYAFGQFSRLTQ